MAVFSANPNILVNPAIQPSQMLPWSATTSYNWGDCVLGSDGMAYCFMAAYDNPQYASVGTTSDPTISKFSLSLKNQTGLLTGGDFAQNYETGVTLPANPNGAQWVNLSLLSPTIPPWNKNTNYKPGDLVFYPADQPTLVWRRNDLGETGQGLERSPPYLPQPGIVSLDGVNTAWNLISNPLQLGSFNPTTISSPPTGLNFAQSRR